MILLVAHYFIVNNVCHDMEASTPIKVRQFFQGYIKVGIMAKPYSQQVLKAMSLHIYVKK